MWWSVGSFYKFVRLSIESRKTKTKVIKTANQKKGKYPEEPMRSQVKITRLPQVRENVGNQVVIG